ncbi:condensation domain-containing protein [Streptomyces sp. NPDC057521]|uniref:condensation domain-containing protein n=1 Tax=Streptomyces sp. NPDC057521 TaxID=3346156 RepID=UPI0036CA7D8D
MIQLPPDEAAIEPGLAHTWHLSFLDAPTEPVRRRPASYNQTVHLGAAWSAHTANRQAGFAIACSFDLPGPVHLPALEGALLHLAHRHEVLRTRCRPTPWGISVHVHEQQDTRLEHIETRHLASLAATRGHLHQLLRRVNPVTGPLVAMGAVVRANSTTVHIVYDHLVADVLSAPITVADLTRAYEDLIQGRQPAPTPASSFWDFAHAERAYNRTLHAHDERLDHWRDFTARSAEPLPAFPLDLGVRPGHPYPSANRTHHLLPDRTTHHVESACRASGGTLLAGLLAATATATAVRDEGGPDTYRALMPLNRRGPDRYAHSIGWFVNAVPIEIPAPRQATLATLIAGACKGYEAGRGQADVHSTRALQLLGHTNDTTTDHHPLAFFSYLDFRTASGSEHPSTRTARVHLWSPASNANFFWFHRNHTGLRLNTLHADTPRAQRTVDSLIQGITRTLRAFAGESGLG